MTSKASSIIGWTCALLVAAFNAFAAVMKFVPVEPGSEAAVMMDRLGMTQLMTQLGILELIVIALYLWPRTSTVGVVLMTGYMGGALATNLTHGFSSMEALPLYISLILIAVSAWFRNPELATRLRGKPVIA